MENQLESIRAALVPEATSETRAAAIEACRAILGVDDLLIPRSSGPAADHRSGKIRSRTCCR